MSFCVWFQMHAETKKKKTAGLIFFCLVLCVGQRVDVRRTAAKNEFELTRGGQCLQIKTQKKILHKFYLNKTIKPFWKRRDMSVVLYCLRSAVLVVVVMVYFTNVSRGTERLPDFYRFLFFFSHFLCLPCSFVSITQQV